MHAFFTVKDSISTIVVVFYVTQCNFAYAENKRDNVESKEEAMYKNCGNSNSKKMCFGESRNCMERKSCTILATITDVDSGFHFSFLDKCQRGMNDSLFFAAAVATFNRKGELDCAKKLSMTDFKVFIFWKEKLCRGAKDSLAITNSGVTKSLYRSGCERKVNENSGKTIINTLDKKSGSSEIDLNLYLNNFVRFSTFNGDWKEAERPFSFPSNMSYTTHDRVFYATVEDKNNDGANGASSFHLEFFSVCCIMLTMLL